MKPRPVLLATALLLMSLLPAIAKPSLLSSLSPGTVTVRPQSDAYSLADLAGTWYYHQLAVEDGGTAGSVEWGVLEVQSDGASTVARTGPDLAPGSDSFRMSISESGEVAIVEDTFRGMMSFDRCTIVASYSDDDEDGLVLLIRPGVDTQFSQADLEDTWRMHSLQAGSGWKGWKAIEGGIDETGSFSGTQMDSDGGSSPYSATVTIDPDGSMEIAEPGNSMVQNAGMADSRIAFGWVMGVNDGSSDIGRFDIGLRTGGDFVTADLAGEWHWSKINTEGESYWGSCIAQADGSISGEYYDPADATTTTYTGTMQVTSSGEITFIDSQMGTIIGEGTLSLDRSLFVMTETLGTTKTMIIGTKHPTEVSASIDVTEVEMDWGNGFSFIENMDLTSEGTLCGLAGVPVHPSNFLTPATPPAGATAAAGLVYDLWGDSLHPIYSPEGIALPVSLSADAVERDGRIMPQLALEGWRWPSRTGDIVIRATIEAPQGDLAPQVGNGVFSSDVGFSLEDAMGWSSDVWLSFGFATMYLPDGIGGLGPGYYNRQPIISYGDCHADAEDFSVVPAEGYDPTYPVDLKVVITPSNLARFFVHFGPPEAEWTLVAEQQIGWWPPADTGVGGCGTGVAEGETWYSPYVSSSLEYVDQGSGSDGEPVEILTTELPDGTAGTSYDQMLAATGGSGSYEWEIVDGELPTGLSLASGAGQISGYPDVPGEYAFTVRASDPSSSDNEDTQELTLIIRPNLRQEVIGQWGFQSINVMQTGGSASSTHGSIFFDDYGTATVYRYQMDGSQTISTFPYTVQPNGQILANNQPWATLSYDNKRMLANRSDSTQGTLTLLAKIGAEQPATQYDAEGSWTMHSFEVGPSWQGWRCMDGEINESGSFSGAVMDSDGSSGPYSAEFTVDGPLMIAEPGNPLEHRGVMSGSGLSFGSIWGGAAAPGVARMDVGIRTGGDFVTEDLEGMWWFYGVSRSGSIFRGWLDTAPDGSFTGENFDSHDLVTEPITGTLSVTPEGEVTITTPEGALEGRFTLSMDRAFFAGTSSEDSDRSLMLAMKRVEPVVCQVDVTHVYMDWGNGFSFDDPLDSDTPGTPCDVSGLTIPAAYFMHPTLDPGGDARALYEFGSGPNRHRPVYEPGRLTLKSTALPVGDNIESEVIPQLALQGTPWVPQTQDMELRATFENLQGYPATQAGSGAASLCIGFEFRDNDRYIGDTMIFLNAVTGYLRRGFQEIPKGYYSRALIANFGCWVDEGDTDAEFLSLIEGHDLSEPVELKLTISPSGLSRAYLRFLPSEEWMSLGEGNSSLWPGAEGWAAGCYSPNRPSGIQVVPFVGCDFSYEEFNGAPTIVEPWMIPNAIAGRPYEHSFRAEDGWSPYTWSIAEGTLPAGLTLSEDGVLSGTPTEPGEFAFTVRVEDGQVPPASDEHLCNIYVFAPASIKDAKAVAEGGPDSGVALNDVVVTRTVNEGFYVEQTDRTAGMLVYKLDEHFAAEGWTVEIEGWVFTNENGEKALSAHSIRKVSDGSVRPIGMLHRNIGGGDFAVDPAVPTSGQRGVEGGFGTNNIGLLVKTWGRVTQVDPSKQYFYIEDGSAVRDGTETDGVPSEGIRVEAHPLGLQPGDWVTVTGISSCFKTDDDNLHPVIRAAEAQVHFPAAPIFVESHSQVSTGGVQVTFSQVLGAAGYRLYQSTDGISYSPTAEIPTMYDGYAIGCFRPMPTVNTYYRVAALNADGTEGRMSDTIFAREFDQSQYVTIQYPPYDSQGVSRCPIVCVPYIPGCVSMSVQIEEAATEKVVWGIETNPLNGGCVLFGERGRLSSYALPDSLLKPGTEYWVSVYAYDAGHWEFGSNSKWPFTTEGTSGGDDPPPPPLLMAK